MEVSFTEAKIPPPPPARSIKPAPEDATPPAGQPPAAAQPPASVPSPAELEKNAQDLYNVMGWGKASVQPTAQSASQASTESPADATAAAAALETQPPAGEPEAEPELTSREAIRETAREVGREVVRALSEPAPEAETTSADQPWSELNESDAEDYRILSYIERSNPARAGIAKAFKDYCLAHYAYQTKWIEANAGKEFNPDDEEHTAFYNENAPDIDPKELEEAKVDMRVEQKWEEKTRPEREAKRAKEAWERELPAICERIDAKVHAMVCQMSPELGKIVTGTDGKSNINETTLAQLEEVDPIAKKIGDDITNKELAPLLIELERIAIPELKHAFNPAGNALHAQIQGFIDAKDRDMANAPRSVQVRNGAQWIPVREYNQRIRAIDGSNISPQQRDVKRAELDRNYWCLTIDMAQDLIVDHYAKKAQRLIEEQDDLAKRKYVKAEKPPGQAAAQPSAQPGNQPQNGGRTASGKPSSPSLGGQPEVSTAGAGARSSAKSFGEQAAEVHFS